ncbi:GTP-binding protein Rhes-like isoform X1 [Varroa jacobsoni]|uniref:GTP-binding protein Rhes n=1 Tax=Varroa destructor TaxID=109461 RepID=A0A7M7M8G8_VARDE|nr:GTP-binding protein Rhes-like isoform X1 [Varroa destructor]XP_022693007.1 GTP-binding protein Rhes-like isoform X1 [Varroa jacobsoni]XP_022693008.1 GTP-binding protein Rhes-like isoform X1 [Varroa jacobsoni]XP_022693009.1 GTP-binding protein Rhes-like isoform X1 [Varroa jacobsoni]
MPVRADSILSTITEASSSGPCVKDHYKLIVMGASRVGKSAIIQQFLYNRYPQKYVPTVEEFHSGEFDFNGASITLDIIDTSGSYEFPAMRRLSIETGDAFLLVFSVDDAASFEQVVQLRDEILVHNSRQRERRSIIVVGNKTDLPPERWRVKREIAEALVAIDWELGYIECSVKGNRGIIEIFRRLMRQCEIPYELNERIVDKQRRKSLPVYNTQPSIRDKALLKRNSCNVS